VARQGRGRAASISALCFVSRTVALEPAGCASPLVVLELFATPGNHLRRSQANVLLVLHVFVMLRSCYR
jgi:hypothetical protein